MVNVSRSPLPSEPSFTPPLPAATMFPSPSKTAIATPTSYARKPLLSTRATAFAVEAWSGLSRSPMSNSMEETTTRSDSTWMSWTPLTGRQSNFWVATPAESGAATKNAANKENRFTIVTPPRRKLSVFSFQFSVFSLKLTTENRQLTTRSTRAQAAVAIAVDEIDHHTDGEPGDEPPPGGLRKVVDDPDTADNAGDRQEEGAEGNAEGPLAVRLLEPQDDDPETDQDEREGRPDVGQVDHLIERREGRRHSHPHARQDRRDVGRAEFRVDLREDGGQQPVARHREEDPRLSELEDQKHGRVRHDRAEGHDADHPVGHRCELHGEGQRLRLLARKSLLQGRVGDHPREDERDDDVDDRADDERADDADRHVPLGVAALLGHGRDRVEADVGEEDDGGAGGDPSEAVGGEGRPVGRLDVMEADEDEEAEHDELDRHHPEVEARRLPDAPHKDDRDRRHDREGQDVENDRDAEEVRRGGDHLRHSLRCRRVIHGQPARQVNAEALDECIEVIGPGDRDGHVADRVFDDQVPADDPGEQLTERSVGVGVGGPRDRNHRGELRIAERREAADDSRQDEREDERGACARTHTVSRGCRADRREDAGTDDRSDAQSNDVPGPQHPLQLVPGLHGLRDERVERLGPEEPFR